VTLGHLVRPYRPLNRDPWHSRAFRRLWIAALGAAVAVAIAPGCGGDEDTEGGGDSSDASAEALADGFDEQRAMRDLKAQVEFGPRPAGSEANREMTEFLAERLREAGVDDVGIQSPLRNVVGVIPGEEEGAIVIGAHHDTKDEIPGFVGANDGASGVAVVLELARVLAPRVDGPSVHIALFDAEEARGDRPFDVDGARGSGQYVRYSQRGGRQGSPPADRIRAMVLFDLVGDCDLQVPRETNSSPELYGLFQDAAESLQDGDPAPFAGVVPPILDDHIPFDEAGIPAVDLIDFTFGPGGSPGAYWHTPQDTLDKVCPESLASVGRAALVALPEIG
jgi:glutaminyl-peptide cyclotransferase